MARKPAPSTPRPAPGATTTSSSTPAAAAASASPPAATPAKLPVASSLSPRSSPQEIIIHVWNRYLSETPSRTMLLDGFMGFLVLVGGVQFLYCIIGGNYPFNAFLSGFSAAVGQFVLTASLRMQTSEQLPPTSTSKKTAGSTEKEAEPGAVSSERAFADFVFGSLILHGFCVNFIN